MKANNYEKPGTTSHRVDVLLVAKVVALYNFNKSRTELRVLFINKNMFLRLSAKRVVRSDYFFKYFSTSEEGIL